MVLMFHNSINKKNGSNLKCPKYGDFTLLAEEYKLRFKLIIRA
jgi:hypothetical protein